MAFTLRSCSSTGCASGSRQWQRSGASSRRLVCRVRASGAPGEDQHPARVVPLPGAMWLLDDLQDRFYDVRGSSFVIQRAESDAAMQGVRRKPHGHKAGKPGLPPVKFDPMVALKAAMRANPGATMFLSDGPVVDVDVDELQAVTLHTFGPVTETGMVHVPAEQAPSPAFEQDDVFVTSSSSPRRTKMLRFVCEAQGCGAVNIKPINPHAFNHGTAFAQCGSCKKWHLIRDHLKLFNALKGNVFPRPTPVTPADVPPSLQLKPEGGEWDLPFSPEWN